MCLFNIGVGFYGEFVKRFTWNLLCGSETVFMAKSHSMGQKRGVGVWWGLNSQIIGLSKYPICYNKGTDSR